MFTAVFSRLHHVPARHVWPLLALALVHWSTQAQAVTPVDEVRNLGQASLLVREQGRDVIAIRADTPRTPASTMKLLTAYAALETWGRSHRFQTGFFLDSSNRLWVKGYADPYLVSEELDRIVAELRARGVRQVSGIGLDDSFFSPDVEIVGRSSSNNPYDAPVTALAANFNTINVIREGQQVRTAEPQTPLTPSARRLALAGPSGKQRVNLRERDPAVHYFGELLQAKMAAAGIAVSGDIRRGVVPGDARLVQRHQDSRSLEQMLVPMLRYSNNFIANALFLHLSAPDDRGQASMANAQRRMRQFARQRLGWNDFRIDDGAGLAHTNRISARQLSAVLDAFTPYRDLLPAQPGTDAVRAKTGTLRGVSCYAGYVRRHDHWATFVLLINQPVDYNFRLRLARSLVQ